MAHKTLVGGTAYAIKGGKCLVGGTAYSIKKGRTLVGGTGYDISFGPDSIPVTITGTGNADVAYVEINGKTYTSETSGIEVMPDDTITCYVRGAGSAYRGRVYVGESVVLGVSQNTVGRYKWSVPLCETITIDLSAKNIGGRGVGTVKVTTT